MRRKPVRWAFLPLALCFFAFCLLPWRAHAQQWNDILSNAERLWAAGQFVEAGEQFERAGRLKPDRPALLFKAAEAYYEGREYGKAADCYRLVRDQTEQFDLAGLRYARALKQMGRYPEAREAFLKCARDYRGAQKDVLQKVIDKDIAGCDLAQRLTAEATNTPLPFDCLRLPEPVNSKGDEFAPMLFNDDVLYFSVKNSARGPAQLWRSERPGNSWQAPAAARGLPPEIAAGFASGAFSVDGKRFYCIQCEENAPADAMEGRPHCRIDLLRRNDTGWGTPEPLRAYINLPESTVAAAAVAQDEEREYLFFASDRVGGLGGLDLYVCERLLSADDLDFSLPRNLGPAVNTGGDETTPFFDIERQTLFFSSNGLVSLGGFDVFQTMLQAGQWSTPENLGLPFNSAADDQWFVPRRNGRGGFVASNRIFGAEKPGTRDLDLFEIVPAVAPRFLVGAVSDDLSGTLVPDCLVSLLEQSPDGEISVAQIQTSPDGRFRFRLQPGSSYAVEVKKDGYRTAHATLGTPNQTPEGYALDLLLHREEPAEPADGGKKEK